MELTGRYRFAGPPSRVWDLLMDPQAIASCVPGCQTFEPIGIDRYRVVLTAGVAAVTGTFEGTVTIVDKQEGASYRLLVEGRGRPGFVNGESSVSLTAEGDDVIVQLTGNMQAGGLVAQVGQRLLGATARMMMDRFFNCLRRKLDGDGK